ncbi:hypothetical protein ACLQ3B_20760 [Micromonospora sp. DT53]|uniref:hypothetical protein n=1 Tax=Micromonospora sp. DT53 TaxID=3393444 RepID=UPI003CF771C8
MASRIAVAAPCSGVREPWKPVKAVATRPGQGGVDQDVRISEPPGITVAELLPSEQARFVLDDMTYWLLVGYGDDPGRAKLSIEQGSRAAASERR